ncbi:MAG: antitoxin family protein [Caldilineaceae bacterium]
MDTTISAIYQQGAFYPLEPLELPESTMVQVQVVGPDSVQVRTDIFHQCLARLYTALPRFSRHWSESVVYHTFAKMFRDDLQMLWYLCSSSQRDLCAMLMLATQNIHEETLSTKQVEAVRFVLSKIAQERLTEAEMEECLEQLFEADLYLTFSLGPEALQDYLDET